MKTILVATLLTLACTKQVQHTQYTDTKRSDSKLRYVSAKMDNKLETLAEAKEELKKSLSPNATRQDGHLIVALLVVMDVMLEFIKEQHQKENEGLEVLKAQDDAGRRVL